MYQINRSHFLYKSLKTLFKDLKSVYIEIARKVIRRTVKNHRVKAVILFGSLAKGRMRSNIVREPSDIDILVLSQDNNEVIKKDLLDFVTMKISVGYGIVIYPIVMSVKEYLQRLENDPLIIGIHANGEVLYGEKPRRFS